MVALLMLLSSKHRNAASALFLVSSAIVTAPLLNVYLFTDFISDELTKDYYGNVDFWNLQRYPARVLELLLFVSRPMGSGTWDGTGGDPILHTAVIQAVFWIGLAVGFVEHPSARISIATSGVVRGRLSGDRDRRRREPEISLRDFLRHYHGRYRVQRVCATRRPVLALGAAQNTPVPIATFGISVPPWAPY